MQSKVQGQAIQKDDGLYFYDFNSEVQDQEQEILQGLRQSPKRISGQIFL